MARTLSKDVAILHTVSRCGDPPKQTTSSYEPAPSPAAPAPQPLTPGERSHRLQVVLGAGTPGRSDQKEGKITPERLLEVCLIGKTRSYTKSCREESGNAVDFINILLISCSYLGNN
eukprot:1431958-Amphidinium_carterae.1